MKFFYKNYFNTLLLAGAVFILSVIFSLSLDKESPNKYQSVLINEGDTLWSIANQYEDDSLTKVEFIDWVEKHNDVRAERLHPGDTIVIPVKRELVQNFASSK